MKIFLQAAALMLLTFAGATVAIVANPCPTEDSSNCYWDASARSNGEGRSFVDIGGMVVYAP